MMSNGLKVAIENIARAKLAESKAEADLNKIIILIRQAKETETKKTAGQTGKIIATPEKLQLAITNIKNAKKNQRPDIQELAKTITTIKDSFHQHWQEEYLPYITLISSLLKHGIPTPVLTVCGKGTMEIRFSRYLAYFMDPSNKHGLKADFLKAVLSEETQGLSSDWFEHCQVHQEYWIGKYRSKSGRTFDCYCDIAVIGPDYACIIEQKILSGVDTGSSAAGMRQLKRYSIAVSDNPVFNDKKIIKIFLTPTGRIESEADGWLALSHEELISRATKLLKAENLAYTAKENLRRLLIDLATGPYKKTEENITEIEKTADLLLDKGFNLSVLLKFRRLVSGNRILLNIITTEG